MTFYEVLEQVVTLLQRHGRMLYRALTRQFQLDEAYLADLKVELVDIQQVAVDHDGIMLVWTGDTPAALAVAVRGLEVCRTHARQGDQAWTLRLLGEIHAHHNPPEAERAAATYREALALAEALGMRPLQAHCHRGLGMLYATTGQPQQARAALAAAIDLYP